MKLLVDTHALLWWAAGDPSMSRPAREALLDEANAVFVSAASAWEIATKYRLGKLEHAAPIAADIESAIERMGFAPLPVSIRHGQLAGALPGPHRDPFDRMLIAQALTETMALVSNEQIFDSYGVTRLW